MSGKYSIEQIHQPKAYGERRNGKTVDAIMEAIGKLMVTERATIAIVVPFLDRVNHMIPMFKDIVKEHFQEVPFLRHKLEWHIKGYTSRIVIIAESEAENKLRGIDTEPVYDL